jgi:hypothetical protein
MYTWYLITEKSIASLYMYNKLLSPSGENITGNIPLVTVVVLSKRHKV